jgi:hypothetical protein
MTTRTFTKSFVAFGLAILAPLAFAQPGNDLCSNAISLGNGLNGGTIVNATASYPAIPCGTAVTVDVWYTYTATCTGVATAQTCAPGSATFDSVIAVWHAAGGCCALGLVGCSDDAPGCGLMSTVQWPCLAGRTYYISIGSFGTFTGTFVLSLSCTAGAPPAPANDQCNNYTPLFESVAISGSNVGATAGGLFNPVAPCAPTGADVWYHFGASVTGSFVATTCHAGTTFDTVLSVWKFACNGSGAVLVSCNDDSCAIASTRSTTTFSAITGDDIYVSVGGYNGQTGDFVLTAGPAAEQMNLFFFTGGIGSIGFEIRGGPPGGPYFAGMTVNHGAYPAGWFLGIDITLAELASEINTPPFTGVLGACGRVRVGPFGGLPSGLAVYGAAVANPPGMPTVYEISAPDVGFVQ